MISKYNWEDIEDMDQDFINDLKKNGYQQPAKVQYDLMTRLSIEKGSNAFIEAPTGSGKTLAYLLVAQQKIDKSKKQSQVLIIAHTIVLVNQIASVAKKLGFDFSICVGMEQKIKFEKDKQLVIATPKAYKSNFMPRMLRGTKSNALYSNSSFNLMIVDEVDYYFDQDEGKEIGEIKRSLPKQCQTMVFSATLEEKVKQNIKQKLFDKEHKQISIQVNVTLNNYNHIFLQIEQKKKLEAVKQAFELSCLESGFQAIIFCKTKKGVEEVYNQLNNDGIAASCYHSDLKTEAKDEQMKKFIDGQTSVLITTDMFARGIDMATMALVINYDLPYTKVGVSSELSVSPITYIHRTGRAGRFGRKGVCLTLVEKEDKVQKEFQEIKKYVVQKYKETEFIEVQIEDMNNRIDDLFKDEDVEQLREQQNLNAQLIQDVSKRTQEDVINIEFQNKNKNKKDKK